MSEYKINIEDREYMNWRIFDATTYEPIEQPYLGVDGPITHRLFTNDVFTMINNQFELKHSTVRVSNNIPGVIILKNNQTYGHKNGKLLYKLIPDDYRLPIFLVPYEIKKLGFSKWMSNLYVTFCFNEWTNTNKHPIAKLSNSIGSVDELTNYYEYQLYCKSLNTSIQKLSKCVFNSIKPYNNHTHTMFVNTIVDKYSSIEDRSSWKIFTIDSATSQELDDAVSICTISSTETLLSIYISNVPIWFDVLDLWDSFSDRISTIYLPDKKRPMLPTILSECLCSLKENMDRIVFVMDIYIDTSTTTISRVEHKNCKIKVIKNYVYEELVLLQSPEYHQLMETCISLNTKPEYKYSPSIKNSHDVISYLMIIMNYYTAKEMVNYQNGIARATITKQLKIPENVPEEAEKFIKMWNSNAGYYIDIQKDTIEKSHSVMNNMEAYIHITSPIRRLVDLLNMTKFQQCCIKGGDMYKFNDHSFEFYDKWINKLEYINTSMRCIRKVQNDCSLLNKCYNDSSILDKEYEGYAFDILQRSDGLFQYMIYLPELKITSKLTIREQMNNYSCAKYKLYLFKDENNIKKKIRLHLI